MPVVMADGEPPEEGVCLDEVLQLNSALEAEAIAVLGGSDPKNCTYSKVGSVIQSFDEV